MSKRNRLFNVLESDYILCTDSGKRIKYKLKRADICEALSNGADEMDECLFLSLIELLNDMKQKRALSKLRNHKAGVKKRKGSRKSRIVDTSGSFSAEVAKSLGWECVDFSVNEMPEAYTNPEVSGIPNTAEILCDEHDQPSKNQNKLIDKVLKKHG